MVRAFFTSGIINRMAPVGRKEVFDSNVFLFYKAGLKAAATEQFQNCHQAGRGRQLNR